ncbi:MAG: hypothetical protein PHU96_06225 [Candidatus Omnitrophica bacterium]|nr:hypothetical protein [Candidatus Omnitrophota bacterium]
MNKEDALNDFLKGLRIVLNNASAYPKGHPYFIESVNNFKQKIEAVFAFLNPIKIVITPDSLFLEGRHWGKSGVYLETAQMLHLRKIKSIEIKQGISVEELADFLSTLAMPKKEFLRQGGIKNILKKEENLHIAIEELDYSQFLGQGREDLDVWVYLLKDAIEKRNPEKLNEFAFGFGKIINKFKSEDLIEDSQLREGIAKFLNYLNDNNKEKFRECVKEIFNTSLKYQAGLNEDQLNKLRLFFKDMDAQDLARLLWDEVSGNDNFDALSFNLFSRLTGKEREKEVGSLFDRIIDKELIKDNPRISKRIHELLSPMNINSVSEVYRNTLSLLVKDISFDRQMNLERELLLSNYRFIIINLFGLEKNEERLALILNKLYKELESIFKEKELKSLKYLADVLKKKKNEEPHRVNLFSELDKLIANFVETNIWDEAAPGDLGYLAGTLGESSLNADFYMNKIFVEGKITPLGLRLFFRLFPSQSPIFYRNLERKYSDTGFLEKVVDSLSHLNDSAGLDALEHIFSIGNELIKLEALRAMQELSEVDREFLFSILKKTDFSLKKEALIVLSKDEGARKKAADILLDIHGLLGSKNKVILQNMMIIEETGLKEAGDYLVSLSRRRFFWNKKIRRKAQEILEGWHAG